MEEQKSPGKSWMMIPEDEQGFFSRFSNGGSGAVTFHPTDIVFGYADVQFQEIFFSMRCSTDLWGSHRQKSGSHQV
jgi:hypothetical protein